MRYLFALICPPLALLVSHRPWQAAVALGLCLVGVATFWWGIGVLLLFGTITWAMNAVSNDQAALTTRQFVRTVKPIRMVRN